MATSEKQSKADRKNNDSGNAGQSGTQFDVGATASDAAGQVQETVTGLKDQVKEQASNQLTSRLESVTSSLDMASRLLRTAGDTVREQEKTGVADSISGVADRLEGWSTSLREQDVDKLIEETKEIAQKQPVLFVSGAVALGFLGARFLASSAKKQEEASGSTSDTSSPSSGTDTSASSGVSSSASAFDTPGTSTLPADLDMPASSLSSLPGESAFENTNPYPSTEENDAIDASMEAPLGADEASAFEDPIVVPDFDDLSVDTTGNKTSAEER